MLSPFERMPADPDAQLAGNLGRIADSLCEDGRVAPAAFLLSRLD